MHWASAISESSEPVAAVREAAGELRARLSGEAPDLVVLFTSPRERADYSALGECLRSELPGALLFGCSARSVIGGGRELEECCGLSLVGAQLPGIGLRPFRLAPAELVDGEAAWRARIGLEREEEPALLLLPDPFSCDVETLVHSLDQSFPASTKLGGLASAGTSPGENALFLGDELHSGGLVGVALVGDVRLDAIVAQGCRPVGSPMFVTRSRQNELLGLDGRAPLGILEELFEAGDERERALYRSSLFLGIELRPGRNEYHQGDYLIRNLLGSDRESGALAVAALLHDGQVVQFHLRDAHTSAADLEARLEHYCQGTEPGAARGALLFSCLGRGQYLYGRPDHDSQAFRQRLGAVPLGGFFCNGEIGPVGQQTFLHGYTSAFGLFRHRAGLAG